MTRRRALGLGAAFLMATSAIGPGFLTQTALFTAQLGASFGFVILISTLLDLGAQVGIWRVLIASGQRAPALANQVLPGLGTVVAGLVTLGGVAFNIGNVAGAGLGLEALFGIPAKIGAVASAALAMGLFLSRDAGRTMDRCAQLLGGVMVLLTIGVAVWASPPLGEALHRTFLPERLDVLAIVTLVGGTVGGYIPYAGGHRLLDAGLSGAEGVAEATRSALTGIGIATVMRVMLFLAALGVVSHGVVLDAGNPAASVFTSALGTVGLRCFGLVMWAAALTSIVGSAYTTASFLGAVTPRVAARPTAVILGFIALSAAVFVTVGRPVSLLILAGALNGLILPASLGALLLAANRRDLMRGLLLPKPLQAAGWIVVLVMLALGLYSLVRELPKLAA